MRPPDGPHSGGIDRDHRACSRRSTQGKLPTPLTAHAPQCRRRRASASWPQPGRAHQTACRPDLESLFPRTPRRSSPSQTPVLSRHPLTRQLQLCYLSFNGRRPPDAPLFQPQLIAALPFSFPASFCVLRASVTCQKHGGRLVSPCAPARWGGAACLVYVHGREGVPVNHTSFDPDRLRQPGDTGCKFDSPICSSCLPARNGTPEGRRRAALAPASGTLGTGLTRALSKPVYSSCLP